jgi:hypothetical protein
MTNPIFAIREYADSPKRGTVNEAVSYKKLLRCTQKVVVMQLAMSNIPCMKSYVHFLKDEQIHLSLFM